MRWKCPIRLSKSPNSKYSVGAAREAALDRAGDLAILRGAARHEVGALARRRLRGVVAGIAVAEHVGDEPGAVDGERLEHHQEDATREGRHHGVREQMVHVGELAVRRRSAGGTRAQLSRSRGRGRRCAGCGRTSRRRSGCRTAPGRRSAGASSGCGSPRGSPRRGSSSSPRSRAPRRPPIARPAPMSGGSAATPRVAVLGDEDDAPPLSTAAHLDQPARALVDAREAVLVGHVPQAAVEPVGPAVVAADERLGAAHARRRPGCRGGGRHCERRAPRRRRRAPRAAGYRPHRAPRSRRARTARPTGTDAYAVLFEEGTERAGTSPLNDEKRAGTFVCAGLPPAALPLDGEVRQRHRLAELLRADRGRARHEARLQAHPAPHRVPLRPLRRPPGPRLRRRPGAHRPALLQQRRGAALRAGGRAAAATKTMLAAVAALALAPAPFLGGAHAQELAVATFAGGCFWCVEPPTSTTSRRRGRRPSRATPAARSRTRPTSRSRRAAPATARQCAWSYDPAGSATSNSLRRFGTPWTRPTRAGSSATRGASTALRRLRPRRRAGQ
jgi:hypothetical protein